MITKILDAISRAAHRVAEAIREMVAEIRSALRGESVPPPRPMARVFVAPVGTDAPQTLADLERSPWREIGSAWDVEWG